MRSLLLSPVPMCPANTGGNQRTALLAMALQRLGPMQSVLLRRPELVTTEQERELTERFGLQAILSPPEAGESPRWARLKHNLRGAAAHYRAEARVSQRVAEIAEAFRPDLIVSRQLRVGRIADLPGIGRRLGARVALDVDDLDWRVYASRLEQGQDRGLARWIVRRHLRQLRQRQDAWLGEYDHLWLASDADRPLVQQASVSVLPNIPYTAGQPIPPPPEPTPTDADPELILVASLNHGPNTRGLTHFLQSVWPAIHRRVPSARLRLIGSGMSDTHKQAWSAVPGVIADGFVPDLRASYAKARAAVSPIYEGGGTKIKVLEALMHARPAVLTPHSYYGYDQTLPEEETVLLGRDDHALAEACITVLTDHRLAATMGQAGYRRVLEHYSFEAFAQTVAGDAQAG